MDHTATGGKSDAVLPLSDFYFILMGPGTENLDVHLRPYRFHSRMLCGFVLALFPALMTYGQTAPGDKSQVNAVAKELQAKRLIGRAYYENDRFAEAIEAFRRCIELAPDSAADHLNLGLVLLRGTKYDQSIEALNRARQLDPKLTAALYIRGIVYKRLSKCEQTISDLSEVLAQDPDCTGAHYNLGVCYKTVQRNEDAVDSFKRAVKLAPDHPSSHYQLMTLYRRLRNLDEMKHHRDIFDRVKDTVDASEKTVEALERSKYSHLIKPPRLTPDLTPDLTSKVRFTDVTEASGLPKPGTHRPAGASSEGNASAAATTETEAKRRCVPVWCNAAKLADYDNDGDLDIYFAHASSSETSTNWLFQNQGDGKFVEVGKQAGVADAGLGCDAVFGDYDNDGDLDLYVVNLGPNVLYRNNGDGTFEDVSKAAHVNESQFGRSGVFVDYDHDNDLDIFIANFMDLKSWEGSTDDSSESCPLGFAGQTNTLLRNNGDGTFSDQTDEAGLLVDMARSTGALFADFDGDFDTELLVLSADKPLRLFMNKRFGKFDSGGTFLPPIKTSAANQTVSIIAGDFGHQGDLSLLLSSRGLNTTTDLYINRGKGHFSGSPFGREEPDFPIGLLDYNNDGWNDLLTCRSSSLRILAGSGPNRFKDLPAAAHQGATMEIPGGQQLNTNQVAIGDLDGDGDQDVVIHSPHLGPMIFRNDCETEGNWIRVRLVGKKVNKSGLGSSVEIASGGHYQKQTYDRSWVHFGIGKLEYIDVVRVTWPNGVAQNVIKPPINQELVIEETVRVSASCGFLYAHNGERFELINEILGVGPLGVPMAPGLYHQPDSTELTKIESDQLISKDGFYELRLTEELRETMYADQFTLRVVDHPGELETIPNEMFTAPPFPEDKLFAVSEKIAPRSAIDDRGNDVRDLILKRDGEFPTFPLSKYEGLAKPHHLTLDLGDLSSAPRIMLFLDGWIHWSESSTVIAVSQNPDFALTALSLSVPDETGNWKTVIESVGLPTSKGLVVPVDLSGRFISDDFRVRLSTNMCIYFDRVFVSTSDYADRCRITELPVASGDLHYRGFSRMTRDELGFERFDYYDVDEVGQWSPPPGMLTRYGDVTPLLRAPDDRYVIFGPGDELTMRFDGNGLPALPPGWTRDFVFYAVGWVKDGDLNTLHSDRINPLPFHAMPGYPYATSTLKTDTEEYRRYQETYNTRPSLSRIGLLPLAD